MATLRISIVSIHMVMLLHCGGAAVAAETGAASDGLPGAPEVSMVPATPRAEERAGIPSGELCVFDYDLTLSSHACPQIPDEDKTAFHCRTNRCGTYSWNDQCLGIAAREAVAECVRRGAFIGIASHADVDGCWDDKVVPIVSEDQFPELTGSERYGREGGAFSYPEIDSRANWNCPGCAYQMAPALSKPRAIKRIMVHYGMIPDRAEDRARVIFWDDSGTNINAVEQEMPEVRTVRVPRNQKHGNDGGCGITKPQIKAAWISQ